MSRFLTSLAVHKNSGILVFHAPGDEKFRSRKTQFFYKCLEIYMRFHVVVLATPVGTSSLFGVYILQLATYLLPWL